MPRPAAHTGVTVVVIGELLSACAPLPPVLPEVFYKARIDSVPDSLCAELATALMDQANLARDSSYELPLGGSRCHEILYAQDGNEVWLQLRANQFTIAARYYPNPGDLRAPAASTQVLADAAVGLLQAAHPDAIVERATERP